MVEFIVSIIASLVATYIAYLFTKAKNHFNSGRRKSGIELEINIKFKHFK